MYEASCNKQGEFNCLFGNAPGHWGTEHFLKRNKEENEKKESCFSLCPILCEDEQALKIPGQNQKKKVKISIPTT